MSRSVVVAAPIMILIELHVTTVAKNLSGALESLAFGFIAVLIAVLIELLAPMLDGNDWASGPIRSFLLHPMALQSIIKCVEGSAVLRGYLRATWRWLCRLGGRNDAGPYRVAILVGAKFDIGQLKVERLAAVVIALLLDRGRTDACLVDGDFNLGVGSRAKGGMASGASGCVLAGVVDDHDVCTGRQADPIDVLHECSHVGRTVLIAAGENSRKRVDNDHLQRRLLADLTRQFDDALNIGVWMEEIQPSPSQCKGHVGSAMRRT